MAAEATRRLILHIGQHKTGTTAIQQTLLNNRALLEARGILYPDIGFIGAGQHKIPGALGTANRQAEAEGYFRALAPLEGTLVLSSENFSRAAPATIARLPSLIDLGRGRGSTETSVVLYIRNFLDVPFAWWQEQVKHGLTRDFPAYLSELLIKPYRNHLLGVTAMIRRYAEAFGKEALRIHLYEEAREAGGGDISVQFMAEMLGITDHAREAGLDTVNRSYDVPAAELIRLLNRFGLKGDRLLGGDRAAQAFCRRLRQAANPYLRTITLDYDVLALRRLERDLAEAWGPLILPTRKLPDGQLFATRSRTVAYLDTMLWIREEKLTAELKVLVSERAAAAAGQRAEP